ncbi:pentapeptide repeat-containing protein [Catenulispora subtropica]|uniref:Pentapeptide repeat-containing protein n=1 Tax=Catenulispora subtropica TaxID=450798 RepID=A0ABN2QNB6_9ACTN
MGELEKKDKRWLWRGRRGSGGPLAPFGVVYLALLGLGTVGALAVYLLLVAFVPGASGSRLDAMKTALLVVAGSGAGAGLYVQYRKQRTDEAKSALDHANSRRDQDKLFTERYTAAAAQLGNAAAAVRLAGVYALARIADDSERDRPTCLEVLCAYLRMPYDPDDPKTEPAERQVRTTAQTAIAARLYPDHPGFWHDARIDLAGAYLIDWNFVGFTVGEFKADRATFSGGAGFGRATFTGDAHFVGATFTLATYFGGGTFNGAAWFNGATFSGSASFGGATFSDFAGFGGATFSGDAHFDEATFNSNAGFNKATFNSNARFDGATFNRGAEFRAATFRQDLPPVWPAGFTEPTEIVWVAPSNRTRIPTRQRTPPTPPTAP